MNKNRHILGLALLLVIISILFPVQSIYAQRKGSKHSKDNALKYSYQHTKEWSGSKFAEPKSFVERSYLSVGMGIAEIWGISDKLGGPSIGVNSFVSLGYWLAPIHGLELNLGMGNLPYASWNLDNPEQVSYTPHITKYWSIGLTYMLHLSSYASMLEEEGPRRWDFIGLVGVKLKQYQQSSIEMNVGMRIKYSLAPGISIYVDPSVSIFNNNLNNESPNKFSAQVTPTFSAGVSISMKQFKHNKLQKASLILDDLNKMFPPPSFNVKLNLLYLLPFAPNIGIEYRFRKPWSIGASASAAWWTNKATHKYYQIGIFELEGRYYMGKKRRHHLGIYAQVGMYDMEFDSVGKLGEFVGAGISYGYLLPISDHFSLDFDIGFGYTNTLYEDYQYDETNGVYEYLTSKRTHLFAPSKVGVSLIWSIPILKKKGGSR